LAIEVKQYFDLVRLILSQLVALKMALVHSLSGIFGPIQFKYLGKDCITMEWCMIIIYNSMSYEKTNYTN